MAGECCVVCSGDSFDVAGEEGQRGLRIRRLEDATRRASTLGVSINVKSVANQAKFYKWRHGSQFVLVAKLGEQLLTLTLPAKHLP